MIIIYRTDITTGCAIDKFVNVPSIPTWEEYFGTDSEAFALTYVEEHFTRDSIERALTGVKSP